jgi:hypothetical protein
MTAEIVHALMQTAERAAVQADIASNAATNARRVWVSAAIRVAEAVANDGAPLDIDVAAYVNCRANWIDAMNDAREASARERDARRVAECAEREWNEEVRGVADSLAEDLAAERALQEAATEKEANNA